MIVKVTGWLPSQSYPKLSENWVFGFFYSNEQLGSLLVDLARQLSFYLYSPILI